ncbi:MAG TPA: sulfite oxidase-like oxidoreductase [Gemmatimonadales bacterium]|nr:sulfite oxidase-like oxidoreductase [Gemmatimonadales bacterium]
MTAPLDVRPTDRDRLPPGQIETRKWPVLHYGMVPMIDRSAWRLSLTGAVAESVSLDWRALLALPQARTLCDIHCVTRWSRFDNVFEGVAIDTLMPLVTLRPGVSHVLVHAAPDYTTNLPLADFLAPGNLLALRHNGEELTAEHGGPVRLLVPHLYLWKSAKWVTGFEFLTEDEPGFWEQNGYHMRGEPWAEERYGRPDPVRMRRGPRG